MMTHICFSKHIYYDDMSSILKTKRLIKTFSFIHIHSFSKKTHKKILLKMTIHVLQNPFISLKKKKKKALSFSSKSFHSSIWPISNIIY